jgi:CheY-like chemotaxis protein
MLNSELLNAMQNDAQTNPDRPGRLALLVPEVAHEIRNLMQSVQGLAEVEHNRATDPESAARLSKITELAQFAGELSTALMSVSSGAPDQSSGDVAEAIRTVSSVFKSHFGEGASLEIVLHEPMLPVALPTSFIELIIFNIARNAVEAMQGSQQRTIRIAAFPVEQNVAVNIWNSGPAIAEDVLHRVFDASVTTKQPAARHGFGLKTVRRLVEQSGGKVSVQNVPQGGVQFEVTLPSRKTPVAALPKTSSKTMLSLVGRRFLVIDDDSSVREVLTMMIKDLGGGTVVPCESGQQALDMTDRNFDIVLLDLRMKGLSGKETFLRLAPELQSRVVFVTGDALTPSSLAIGNGADRPVMFKPVSFSKLCEVVSKHFC